MAFTFPRPNSRAAEHITPAVIECLEQWAELPTRPEAAARARNFFRTTTTGANGLYSMCMLADDSIALCFFGIRNGFQVVWNFGKPPSHSWAEVTHLIDGGIYAQ